MRERYQANAGGGFDAELGEPVGVKFMNDWFVESFHVESVVDEATGHRVSRKRDGSTSRTPTATMTSHSCVHAPWVDGSGWPTPDVDDFPDYYKAHVQRFTLKAGDSIYIPGRWWHWVFSDSAPGETTIALNMWTSQPHHGFAGCNLTALEACGDEPELLPGHAADWPALKKWTLPFLQATAAKEASPAAQSYVPDPDNRHSAPPAIEGSTFAVGTCAKADHVYPEMFRRHIRQPGSPVSHFKTITAMADALTELKGGGHPGFACHGVAPLDRVSKTLARSGDVVLPKFSQVPFKMAEQVEQVNLWITSGKVHSGLHYDTDYNTLTVLTGTKHVFLFPPGDSKYLYPTAQGHSD